MRGRLTRFGEAVRLAGGRSIQHVAEAAGLSIVATRRAVSSSPRADQLPDPRTVRAILDAFPAIERGFGYRLAFDVDVVEASP